MDFRGAACFEVRHWHPFLDDERGLRPGVNADASPHNRAVLPGPDAARPLDTIVLYGTGFGPTVPDAVPGEVVAAPAPILNPVTIRIGQAAAQVLYAGMTGVGLYQFNVVVPDLPNGDYPVVAQFGGVRTSSAARLRVQR